MTPAFSPSADGSPCRVLIEGWRGINHSFALVNQFQILELLRFPELALYHRDLPFFLPHWNARSVAAGFSEADRQRIDSLPPPDGRPMDCVYRAGYPYGGRLDLPTLSFMVTEYGLAPSDFLPDAPPLAELTREGNRVLTPTAWSRQRLIDYGLDPAGVLVLPHGVDAQTFRPLSAEERERNRGNLGIPAHAKVFLNLGVATWNKGIDLVLTSFALLRQRHPDQVLVLVVKDQRSLYGLSVENVIADAATRQPGLFTADTLAAIRVVGSTLSQAELRLLYGIADVYVSPYRAEGFNLPVLEAIACGTPVIATAGGATDDFLAPGCGRRVDSRPGRRANPAGGPDAIYLEPDLDALLNAMAAVLDQRLVEPAAFAASRTAVVARMSWRHAASQLRALFHQSARLAGLPLGAL